MYSVFTAPFRGSGMLETDGNARPQSGRQNGRQGGTNLVKYRRIVKVTVNRGRFDLKPALSSDGFKLRERIFPKVVREWHLVNHVERIETGHHFKALE